jgi:hypothetical protein
MSTCDESVAMGVVLIKILCFQSGSREDNTCAAEVSRGFHQDFLVP